MFGGLAACGGRNGRGHSLCLAPFLLLRCRADPCVRPAETPSAFLHLGRIRTTPRPGVLVLLFSLFLQYFYKYKGQRHKNFSSYAHKGIETSPMGEPMGEFPREQLLEEAERFGENGQELGHLGQVTPEFLGPTVPSPASLPGGPLRHFELMASLGIVGNLTSILEDGPESPFFPGSSPRTFTHTGTGRSFPAPGLRCRSVQTCLRPCP